MTIYRNSYAVNVIDYVDTNVDGKGTSCSNAAGGFGLACDYSFMIAPDSWEPNSIPIPAVVGTVYEFDDGIYDPSYQQWYALRAIVNQGICLSFNKMLIYSRPVLKIISFGLSQEYWKTGVISYHYFLENIQTVHHVINASF